MPTDLPSPGVAQSVSYPAPTLQHQYQAEGVDMQRPERTLDGEDLAYFEREVIETVKVALQQPLDARIKWFYEVMRAMHMANRALGWNGVRQDG